jgi:adenylosuccinate lyase
MAAHMIDSALFRGLFGTDAMRAIFSDESLVQAWLDTEAALARSQAALDIIPQSAADQITACAQAQRIDFATVRQGVERTTHPLVSLITLFASICPDGSGQYVHWGATTQDIMDTAVVLQLRSALLLMESQLDALVEILVSLAEAHRETIMAGRTHGQHALPITFGFKLAVLISEFERHRQRLAQCRPRLLVVELSGAVGTMASFGTNAHALQARFADELDLGVPAIGWHTARDAFTEFVFVAALIGASCAKAAKEVIALQKTEVAEIAEPNTAEHVGSSTMPQKRNPMLSEGVVSIGRILRQQPAMALDAMVQEHERDMSAWQSEWEFIPESAVLVSGALELTRRIYAGLSVDPNKMLANLAITGGLINAEAVMMALAPTVGRQRAHAVVGAAARRSYETGVTFAEALASEPEVVEGLTPSDIERLLDPSQYLGAAIAATTRVVEVARADLERSSGGSARRDGAVRSSADAAAPLSAAQRAPQDS